ncbi:MAG: histidine phosphatase family protein [Woeseiaceae bacterium]
MKTLTLFRHAKSSWAEPGLSDHDRPLNDRGEHDAPRMARRLVDVGIRPSLMLSSTALRAWTTARLVAREIAYPAEFLQRDRQLYLATRKSILEVVARQENGFNNIVLFGHNPGLTDLAEFLVPGVTDNIPTCGFFSVNIDIDSWDVATSSAIELIAYDYPKNRN